MKTLRLTLTKKWFDMILLGEKPEEYREIKAYWKSRLCHMYGTVGCDYSEGNCGRCEFRSYSREKEPFNLFDAIEFRNGYSKDAPTMLVECKGITTGIGYPRWGAPSHPVFIIKLGKVIETKNIK